MNNDRQLMVKMALDSWQGQVKATTNLLTKLTDGQLVKEIAPGRNRGVYLLGHLTAVHDLMFPLLGFGESQYADLQAIYVDALDRFVAETPAIPELKAQWLEVNDRLLA